nr:hypothetical protein Iba_chr04aCG5150 [Ipomoea batatas]GMC81545.1 hypothetical protein Iba_chr04bCG4990 [Ipomoea batatas]GMC83841.1 hypothetical protein Iba_chr04cCG5950 [Ipomoea batatas]GMC88024.1 hypothetical protein Iba_chr04eCG6120 [Ipomoea batatas]GME13959.1 hypothetical protein Iba_scaffold14888CG0030 [Ipomoea batatas]
MPYQFYQPLLLEVKKELWICIQYLHVQIINFFNCILNITRLHCLLNCHPIGNGCKINIRFSPRFNSELFCCFHVTLGD